MVNSIVCALIFLTLMVGCNDFKKENIAKEKAKSMAEAKGITGIEIMSVNKIEDGIYTVKGKGLLADSLSRARYYGALIDGEGLFAAGKHLRDGSVSEEFFSYTIDLSEKAQAKANPVEHRHQEEYLAKKNIELTKEQRKGPYKKFEVTHIKTETDIRITIKTDLPDGTPLMVSTTKAGLRDNDIWIGDDAHANIMNGKAEINFPIWKLEKGRYDLEVFFNCFWLTGKDISPTIKSLIGVDGENLRTPYIGSDDRSGRKYKTIEYKKKAAFKVP